MKILKKSYSCYATGETEAYKSEKESNGFYFHFNL